MSLAIQRLKFHPLPATAIGWAIQAFDQYGFPRSIVMDLDKWPLSTFGIGAALQLIDTLGIAEQGTDCCGN